MDLSLSQSSAPIPSPTKYLSVPEVAERWACENKLIYAASGRLAALRIGRKLLRVALSEIERYESEQTSRDKL
jgi:hypothetical protein